MQIFTNSASRLCKRVVEELSEWRTLPAILQVGGIESRASSRIVCALEAWLADEQRPDLLVIPEFRLSSGFPTDETTDSTLAQAADKLFRGQRIDYALVKGSSIGNRRLEVDTVVEVKTNYFGQSDLQKRPLAACNQAETYGEKCSAKHTYVLYIVASANGAPRDCSIEKRSADAGWGYFRERANAIPGNGPIAAQDVRIIGQHPPGSKGHPIEWADARAEIWACLLQRK